MDKDELVSELEKAIQNVLKTNGSQTEKLQVLEMLEKYQVEYPRNEEILALLIHYCDVLHLKDDTKLYFEKLNQLNPEHSCVKQYADIYRPDEKARKEKDEKFLESYPDLITPHKASENVPDWVKREDEIKKEQQQRLIYEKKTLSDGQNSAYNSLEGDTSEKDEWRDPDCLSTKKTRGKYLLPVVLLLLAFVIIFKVIISPNNKKISTKSASGVSVSQSNGVIKHKDKSSKPYEITLNPATEYNYLTKQQIYDIRKKQVALSDFADAQYEPSEEIFGQIVDNKPWWGLVQCHPLNYNSSMSEMNIVGPSKVSVMVNNPDMLLNIMSNYMPYDTENTHDFCMSRHSVEQVPSRLEYNPSAKLYTLTYLIDKSMIDARISVNGKLAPISLQVQGLNAKDFGYKYAYISSYNNIHLQNDNNMSQKVVQFKDFLHLGGSCGYQDGCNNISPYQADNEFYIIKLPAQIVVKLWSHEPSSTFDLADINFRIVFEEAK